MFLVVGLTHNSVIRVYEQHRRLMDSSFLRCEVGVSHDDNLVAHFNAPCRSTIEAYNARASLAGYYVSLQSAAIVYVDNLHLLIFHDARLLKQV